LNFLGNATTSSSFQFPTLSAGPGDFNVNINQPTANIGTTVTFAAASGTGVSIGRFNNAGTYFFSSTGAGTLGGGAGSNPTVISTSVPLTFQGVISTSGTASAPYAFVTQSSAAGVTGTFANYDTVNGVVAATLVARDGPAFAALGTTAPNENTNFVPTAGQPVTSLNGPVTVQTLTINPGAAGQTLIIGGSDLTMTGLALSGNRDFTITADTGHLFGTNTSIREIAVLDPNAALITNANLAGGNAQLNKAGPGFLILNNAGADQLAFSTPQRVNITGGVLRMPAAFINGTGNTINFRGGVLEVDGGGQASTFSRQLGVTTGAGFVNWRGTTTAGTSFADNGSGGFSAVNGNLTVAIQAQGGGSLASFVWGDTNTIGTTTYDTPFFVIGANALLFGSTRSNSTVNWTNPLGLDNGVTGLPSAMREIRVTAGTGVAADKTQITSIISGSAATSLLKTGTGTLELTGANTYAGPTVVNAGTLLVNNPAGSFGTGTGTVTVNNGARIGGTGTIGGNLIANAGAIIRPGNSPGNLTVGGSVTMTAGSKYGFQYAGAINSAPPDSGGSAVFGVGNSHMSVGGTLTIDPAAGFNFTGNGGAFSADFAPGQSYSFQVAAAGTVVPFNITNPAQFTVSGFTGFPGFSSVQWHNLGNTVYFNFTPVPEPVHMLLVCGAATFGCGWIRRRKLARQTA
jgi:fibronectin-binding autotransporter adhesin